jgi:hypothetical protein
MGPELTISLALAGAFLLAIAVFGFLRYRHYLKTPHVSFSGWRWNLQIKWQRDTKARIRRLVKDRLLPHLKRTVVVHVPYGRPAAPINDGKFHIHLWSATSGEPFRHNPKNFFDDALWITGDSPIFAPSGRGLVLSDPNGWELAELIGENNLYVLYRAFDNGEDEEFQVFQRLLGEFLDLSFLSAEQREERRKRLLETAQLTSRRNLLAHFTDPNHQKSVAAKSQALAATWKKIADSNVAIFAAGKSVTETELELKGLSQLREKRAEKASQEFDKIAALPDVTAVSVQSGVLTVLTRPLTCVDPRSKKRHAIGAFRIQIYMNGDRGGVRWENMTRRVQAYKPDMHAPHILPSGEPCIGTAQELFPRLVGSEQYSNVARMAIQFVQSVNTNDKAGSLVDKWPLVEPSDGQKTV